MLKVVWFNHATLEKSGKLRTALVTTCGWQETSEWNFVEQPTGTVMDPGRLIEKVARETDICPLVTIEGSDITIEIR